MRFDSTTIASSVLSGMDGKTVIDNVISPTTSFGKMITNTLVNGVIAAGNPSTLASTVLEVGFSGVLDAASRNNGLSNPRSQDRQMFGLATNALVSGVTSAVISEAVNLVPTYAQTIDTLYTIQHNVVSYANNAIAGTDPDILAGREVLDKLKKDLSDGTTKESKEIVAHVHQMAKEKTELQKHIEVLEVREKNGDMSASKQITRERHRVAILIQLIAESLSVLSYYNPASPNAGSSDASVNPFMTPSTFEPEMDQDVKDVFGESAGVGVGAGGTAYDEIISIIDQQKKDMELFNEWFSANPPTVDESDASKQIEQEPPSPASTRSSTSSSSSSSSVTIEQVNEALDEVNALRKQYTPTKIETVSQKLQLKRSMKFFNDVMNAKILFKDDYAAKLARIRELIAEYKLDVEFTPVGNQDLLDITNTCDALYGLINEHINRISDNPDAKAKEKPLKALNRMKQQIGDVMGRVLTVTDAAFSHEVDDAIDQFGIVIPDGPRDFTAMDVPTYTEPEAIIAPPWPFPFDLQSLDFDSFDFIGTLKWMLDNIDSFVNGMYNALTSPLEYARKLLKWIQSILDYVQHLIKIGRLAGTFILAVAKLAIPVAVFVKVLDALPETDSRLDPGETLLTTYLWRDLLPDLAKAITRWVFNAVKFVITKMMKKLYYVFVFFIHYFRVLGAIVPFALLTTWNAEFISYIDKRVLGNLLSYGKEDGVDDDEFGDVLRSRGMHVREHEFGLLIASSFSDFIFH